MKFLFAATALAASALAGSSPGHLARRGGACSPPEYRCTWSAAKGFGWEVCTAQGTWVYGGSCAPGHICEFNVASQSPYCLPGPVNEPSGCGDYNAGDDRCGFDGSVFTIEECSGGSWKVTQKCASHEKCVITPHGAATCRPDPDCVPPAYRCAVSGGTQGWEVCNVGGKWVWGGECPESTSCETINDLPFCT